MKYAIIVDIDGTLANCDHRKHFMEQKPKDWDSFYRESVNDSVNHWCSYLLREIFEKNDLTILLVTGRPAQYRSSTQDWLEQEEICYAYLFMRQRGDFRKDAIVKQEIYEREIKGKYEVVFVIDDRRQCVDMWRAQGLVCLQCAPGEF